MTSTLFAKTGHEVFSKRRAKFTFIYIDIYICFSFGGHINLGNFYAKNLVCYFLRPKPSAMLFAPGSCPGVGLGGRGRGWYLCTFDMSVFFLKKISVDISCESSAN